MPSRSVRRRRIKQEARLGHLGDAARQRQAAEHLARWRREARRRADDLGAPAVWDLERRARPMAQTLDASGELAEELARICAEAVAQAAGRHLVGVSRPLADRSRVGTRNVITPSRT